MVGLEIARQFGRMGARAAIGPGEGVRLDIGRDRYGQYFDVRVEPAGVLQVVDVRSDLRHLLLHAQVADGKHKFLCGHDEREWFVAGIPGDRGVSNVRTAMEALKPPAVRAALDRMGVRAKNRNRRRNDAFVRQGEWFFLPRPAFHETGVPVLRNEPLRRGAGKPHFVHELCRTGGETVYVNTQFPNGITEAERADLFRRNAGAKQLRWTVMRRNAVVLVRGRVTHPDHATIVLPFWHQVLMNEEHRAASMRHVAFLD